MTDEKKEPLSGAPQTAPQNAGAPQADKAPQKKFTRRAVIGGAVGAGLVGLIAGGVLTKWGVIEDSIASGRIDLGVTPTKLIVTDRARCSGCQRCELACTLRNDGRASHA